METYTAEDLRTMTKFPPKIFLALLHETVPIPEFRKFQEILAEELIQVGAATQKSTDKMITTGILAGFQVGWISCDTTRFFQLAALWQGDEKKEGGIVI